MHQGLRVGYAMRCCSHMHACCVLHACLLRALQQHALRTACIAIVAVGGCWCVCSSAQHGTAMLETGIWWRWHEGHMHGAFACL